MPSLLHTTSLGDAASAKATVFFLHGILGKGRNWQRFATDLLNLRPDLSAVLVDLRLHGGSQGFSPPHTVRACGGDVIRLIEPGSRRRGGKVIVIGHSFGGKVALEIARQAPHLLSEIWLIDSFPGLSAKQGDAWKMIEWLKKNEGPFGSRTQVMVLLKQENFSDAIASWMATNLQTEGGSLKWAFPIADIADMLEDYALTDLTPVLLDPPCPVHVVKGTKSPLITDDLIRKMKASKSPISVILHAIEAGHWIHTENPKALLNLMVSELIHR